MNKRHKPLSMKHFMEHEMVTHTIDDLTNDFGLVNGKNPILGYEGDEVFSGNEEDYIDLAHDADLSIANGTYMMHFNATQVDEAMALFSKDASGYLDGGHLMAYISDGGIYIRMQSDSHEQYISVKDVINAGEDYHLAITFGEEGLKIYLNGGLAAAEPLFKQSMEMNQENLVIGASGAYRSNNTQNANKEFMGTISNFLVYGEDLDPEDIAEAAGEMFQEHADFHLMIEDLMPAFTQLHSATDYLKTVAAEYGYEHHVSSEDKTIIEGTDEADSMVGTIENDYLNGKMGNDTIEGGDGADQLQGGYGNDDIYGQDGDDVLDGGHGEDSLNGGAGNDFLISRSDGREPYITPALRDEGDPLNELDPDTGKLYPDQPLDADDTLTGGEGADTFYFQTLINGKERFLEEHTNNDGTINWHGVAGENDKLHDHWVDEIGNDVITDFNRQEGDVIVIEGHTTNILDITYHDSNNDGVVDYSKIHLYSDQGNNGGAHNDDLLGTITIYGDLVKESDIQTSAAPAYGIVKTIDSLDEAIEPLDYGSDRGDIFIPSYDVTENFGVVNGNSPIFGIDGIHSFTGEDGDYLDITHSNHLMIPNGTYAMHFNTTTTDGTNALFSKDANGNREGGHLTAYIKDGKLIVRMQSAYSQKSLEIEDSIETGQDYHLAITFGEEGLKIYLNGELATESTFKESMELNYQNIVVGASGAGRNDSQDDARDEFTGTISDFAIYDTALDIGSIELLSQFSYDTDITVGSINGDSIQGTVDEDNIVSGASQDTVKGGSGDDTIYGEQGDDWISGGKDNDKLFGGGGEDYVDGNSGNDEAYGGDGNDTILGGSGNDILLGNEGDDSISGGSGDDYIQGNAGSDTISGSKGNDNISGYEGADSIHGGSGNDILDGGSGEDTIRGASGNDSIFGGEGDDSMNGGEGTDFIRGEEGNDSIWGGSDNDSIIGGDGIDQLKGDSGSDMFVWTAASESGTGIGNRDIIKDFTSGEDKIDLSSFSGNFTFVSGGNGEADMYANMAQVAYMFSSSDTIVYVDSDGDNHADFEIEIDGENISLSIADFIL